jgi:hypothetical protein
MKALPYIYTFLSYYDSYKTNKKEWVKKLQDEWEETKELPRKKKKEARKAIKAELDLALYDPIEEMLNI